MGGMGAVYKARDMEVERVVGLNGNSPRSGWKSCHLARFKQELVLARQVTHKNIIRIYDLNEADGVKFITMEFIEGEDLRSILTRQGKLLPEEAVDIMLQVAPGCRRPMAEGVIHRDLKPSNIMRDPVRPRRHHGLRFGRTVARRRHDPDRHDGRDDGVHVARAGHGQGAGCPSDSFAVGLIFYEMSAALFLSRGKRHRQPGEAHAGTRCSASGCG